MSRQMKRVGVCFAAVSLAVASVTHAQDDNRKASLSDELPRIPATEPADALKTFTVQRGFRLELVASEPDVSDPVDACFDEHGRMYVAEMHGYPFSQEPTRLNPKGGGKTDAGVIRMLEDTDGDGRMDVSVKFAGGIRWPTSVCCWGGGVFVMAPPNVWYFKDTDGDRVADLTEIVFEGIGRDNVQGVANNLKWGLDNRIYAAGGRNPSTLTRDGEELLTLGGKDFSFDPLTYEVRAETGGQQFGHSFDDWGNRFVCSNSNHIQHIVFPWDALSRNAHYPVSGPIRSIAKEGAAAPVFRRSSAEPWRIVRTRRRVADPRYARLPATERVPIGFFTSATSVTVYRGAAWPEEYRGQVFIGDVGGNLVHRKRLEPQGVSFTAIRADKDVEFIASTDNWFRPTNFVNTPDGTLYVLDMYRETIEHPYSIPEDIKSHLDLESGDTRGRIYRLAGPNGRRLKVESLGALTAAALVPHLKSPNAWTRETAHRLLVERNDKSTLAALRDLIRLPSPLLSRVHALNVLLGMGELTPRDIEAALANEPEVAAHAIRLAQEFLPDASALATSLLKHTSSHNPQVLFSLGLTLGHMTPETATPGFIRLLSRNDLPRDVRTALMTSIGNSVSEVLTSAIRDKEFVKQTGSAATLSSLIGMLASHKDTTELVKALGTAADSQLPFATHASILIQADEALRRRGVRLRSVLAAPQAAATRLQLATMLSAAAAGAMDPSRRERDRLLPVRFLQLSDEDTACEILGELLSPSVSQSLQLTAVSTLSRQGTAKAAPLLLEHWRGFSPKVRTSVVDMLTSTVARSNTLLDAIGEGQVRSAELSRERKQLLLNHPNAALRDRAVKQFAAEVNADRAAVVDAYRSALELESNLERGQTLFMKKCSICHRVGAEGKQVGPDIVSVTNKSPDDLLLAMLDPNREAQPNFNVYTIVTEAGRVFNGIIVSESAVNITLRQAEGKQDTIARADIAQLLSTGKSLMPEGLEKDLSKQQVADVIAFIKSLGQKKAKTP